MAYTRTSVPRPSTAIDIPDNCIYASERLTAVPGTLEACKTATEAGVCSGANGAAALIRCSTAASKPVCARSVGPPCTMRRPIACGQPAGQVCHGVELALPQRFDLSGQHIV